MSDPASELRYSIERGAFVLAGEIWTQWTQKLESAISSGTLDPAEWQKAIDLYRWSRSVLLAERAHLLDRLNKLQIAGAYRQASISRGGILLCSRM